MRRTTDVWLVAPRPVCARHGRSQRPLGLPDAPVFTPFRRVSLARALASSLMIDTCGARPVPLTHCRAGATGLESWLLVRRPRLSPPSVLGAPRPPRGGLLADTTCSALIFASASTITSQDGRSAQ